MKVNLRIPGKLFIVGEYTSVEGSKSIILPTKKTINFEVVSDKRFIILSNQWSSDIIYNPKNLDTNETWGKGLKIAYDFLRQQNIKLIPNKISVDSDLDVGKVKLGLGTSGAFLVGVIQSVLQYHKVFLSPHETYKLSVLALKNKFEYSSFGDIACSCFNCPILYRKPNELIEKKFLKDSIEKLWKGLIIKPLETKFPIFVINTGRAGHTEKLVDLYKKKVSTETRKKFIRLIDKYVKIFKVALEEKNIREIKNIILYCYHVQIKMDQFMDKKIITKEMNEIFTIGEKYNIVGKVSGAGGGDNIFFIKEKNEKFNKFKTEINNKYKNIDGLIRGIEN